MLSEQDKKIFSTFAGRIRRRFPEAKIWAFGSRTRGDASPESDLDVCVVLDYLNDAVDTTVMEIAWETGFENDIVISTVTYSRQEFEKGPCSESGLVHNILDYGTTA